MKKHLEVKIREYPDKQREGKGTVVFKIKTDLIDKLSYSSYYDTACRILNDLRFYYSRAIREASNVLCKSIYYSLTGTPEGPIMLISDLPIKKDFEYTVSWENDITKYYVLSIKIYG